MSNLVKLLRIDDLHLVNIIAHFYKFEPTLILTDHQRLRIKHTNASDSGLTLQILHKFELALHIIYLKLTVPRTHEDVGLRRANSFRLVSLDLRYFA